VKSNKQKRTEAIIERRKDVRILVGIERPNLTVNVAGGSGFVKVRHARSKVISYSM